MSGTTSAPIRGLPLRSAIRSNSRPPDDGWEQHKLCYMPVNRAATHSIGHALKRGFGKADVAMPASMLNRRPDWFVFSFVRSPWERLVSAYANNVISRKMTAPLKQRGFTGDMSLGAFVSLACSLSDEDADKHFVSQVYRLSGPDGKLIPDFIGRVETMNYDWARLKVLVERHTGIRLPNVEWRKKTTRRKARIPDQDTKRLQAMVRKRFNADYATFGFDI